MAKALVTGASGFIGGRLVEQLVRRGRQVRCLLRATSRTERLAELDYEPIVGDVTDAEAVARAVDGVDEVYHVAGLIAAFNEEAMMTVNRDGVRHVVQACAETDSSPVHVLVSSLAAAGPVQRGEVRDVRQPPAPISEYGRSKRAGERMAEQWADRTATTIVRPGIVFGPHNKALLPAFRALRRLRIHVVPGWSPPPLSWIYVDDLVEILIRAAERGRRIATDRPAGFAVQGAYFAADQQCLTYAEIGHLAQVLLNRPYAPSIYLPSAAVWSCAGLTELISRLRGRVTVVGFDKMREALASSWACSAETTRRELDFAPPQSLEERLRTTIDWYRAERWL